MIAYLDTNVAVWVGEKKMGRLSQKARSLLETSDLKISPMVLLELEFLHEIRRTKLPARDVQLKVEHELGVRVCELEFSSVVATATGEKWTRDPFDRVIVAHAKANGFAALISGDEMIQKHYQRTVW